MSAGRLRRTLGFAGALVICVLLVGATYQGVATAVERRRFPHPGKLIDAGGHQLHLYCTGEGSPTVVLEAPAAGMSAVWAWVQPIVEQQTRVCSYDRAGLGWSEAGDRAYSPAAAADQLAQLLANGGERPPFVVAGQGFGAALARLDAARLGADAAALVLIDAPAPDGSTPAGTPGPRVMDVSPWLARAGLLRAIDVLAAHAAGFPPPQQGAVRTFLNRPDHLTRAAAELARWNETMRAAAAVELTADLPVVTARAGDTARIAFLASEAEGAAAARTILDTVAAVRRR